MLGDSCMFIDYVSYIIYKIFKLKVLLLPKFFVKYYLDMVAATLHFIDRRHRRYAMVNLDIVFGNTKTLDEKKEIIRKNYKILVYNLYEFIQNQHQNLQEYEKKITVQNEDVIHNAIKNNRKIILITAHYGNWEYGNTYFPLKYKAATMVGKPMKNKFINDELFGTREVNNCEMLTRKNASKGLVKALKQDRVIGLVIDQHDSKGIDIDFFGKKCKMIDSSSRLALKFDALIVPLFFRCDGFGKYTAVFHDGIEPSVYKGENEIYDLTLAQAKVIEKQILDKPENWFWQHRRWKEYFKEIYK